MLDPTHTPKPPRTEQFGGIIAINGQPHLRPCDRIEPEALADSDFFQSIANRYEPLTHPLPLAGAAMMSEPADGELRLIARLRAEAPWLAPAINTIERQLRVQLWAGRPWVAWRPLCLVGPPGTGKSHLARLIGSATSAGCRTLDLGGVSDSRALEGTARGWSNTQPCWPAVAMAQTRTANPVLVLEEVDKAGGSAQGGVPHATLLTMLERDTARRYWDKCLLAEVDLSHCCWILTANDASLLPPMLRSRLDIVRIDGPQPEDFDAVLGALVTATAAEWGVPQSSLPTMPEEAVAVLRNAFGRTRSVRTRRRHLERVLGMLIASAQRDTH